MRIATWVLVLLATIASIQDAQPQDGDLILAGNGLTGYLNPARPATLTTLATAVNHAMWGVRMAPDNTDMVFVRTFGTTTGLVSLRPDGTGTTLVQIPDISTGIELDHDDTWMLCRRVVGLYGAYLVGVNHGSRVVTTFGMVDSYANVVDLAIDREPGASPYCLARVTQQRFTTSADLIRADRQPSVSALGSLGLDFSLVAVELHPRSGDYLVADRWQTNPALSSVQLMTKQGRFRLLTTMPGYGMKVTQDDHVWIVGQSNSTSGLLKFDLSSRAVVTWIPAPGGRAFGSVEVYGSRRLVCNGSGGPGTSVLVRIQSRKPGDGGKSYALGCSFNRRPPAPARCLRFPNGEYLFLDYSDPLFRTTVLAPAPAVFQNFQGALGSNGNATARVNIPSKLPPNLGITIFVAGVIYDATGVRTVTNTHWFVL